MKSKPVYGIDLGTTYSCIAHVDEHDKPVVLANAEGEQTTPSVVFFESESNIVVGQAAKEVAAIYADRCVSTVKRAMGDPHWEREFFGQVYKPQDVSSFILRKVVKDAESLVGEKVEDVVITCPAYFGVNEKEATRQAGILAGLNVLYVIPEPTAAALAYGMEEEGEQTVLVFDLGGGTFDVTVIAVRRREITVICTGGDHQLGGKNWDDAIVAYFAERFEAETGTAADALTGDQETYQELLNAAERCKKSLSTRESVVEAVRFGGERARVELTRETFDRITAPYLERTLELTQQVLDRAREKSQDRIDRLLLVGGSTYMPQVIESVKKRFPFEVRQYDPNQAVAKGAAIFGFKCQLDEQIRIEIANTTGQRPEDVEPEAVSDEVREQATKTVAQAHGYTLRGVKELVEKKITNVSSKSFGVVVMNRDDREVVANLVKIDDQVPKTITQQFGTYAEGQVQVDIVCMENQRSDDELEKSVCVQLGSAVLPFDKPLPKGSPIEITFDIGPDGVLKVRGRDLTRGNEIDARYESESIMSREELESAAARNRAINLEDLAFGPGEVPPAQPFTTELHPDREITARLAERPAGDDRPLEIDAAYHLEFKVGQPVTGNLLVGETRVAADEVPSEELDLQWVVHSREVELLAGPGVEATADILDEGPAWTARFELCVPERGESEIRTLGIVPRRVGDARLEVLLLRQRRDDVHGRWLREVYRQLALRLAIDCAGRAAFAREPGEPLSVAGDATLAAAGHLNLRTPHEWATPTGELSVTVGPGAAYVQGDVVGAAGNMEARNQWTTWHAKPATVDGPMQNARGSAERFRARWEDYLDEVDPADLDGRLDQPFVPYDWHALPDAADAAHQAKWREVAASPELRDLAFDGHALYQAFFPPGSELRGWLDGLPWGHRLNLSWLPFGGADFVPHVPWGLMYRRPAPPPGTPVEPMEFLGLGFRIGYTSHQVDQPSKALGARGKSTPAFLLYWGSDAGDETAAEAAWQRGRWSGWPKGVVIPAPGAAPAAAKQELLAALGGPGPSPATLLYLYCQASVGQGNDPVLRFGTDLYGGDEVRRTELPQQPLADGPLVFANACSTAGAGAYMTNLLEESFFQRGCRAFLGTETKVPIAFASRFAAAFFHFFSLRVPEPLAAGEAMALARLFLWCHYRNLGGILYSYVNQYELFLADDAEVRAMRA